MRRVSTAEYALNIDTSRTKEVSESPLIQCWLLLRSWLANQSCSNLFCEQLSLPPPTRSLLNSNVKASAQQITALINLSNQSYEPSQWQTALLSWVILLLAIFANTVLFRKLPLLEGFVIFVHVLGFFAFVIVLWCVFSTQRLS